MWTLFALAPVCEALSQPEQEKLLSSRAASDVHPPNHGDSSVHVGVSGRANLMRAEAKTSTGSEEHKDPNGGFDAAEAAVYWGKDLNASNEVSHCIATAINTFAVDEGYRSIADYGAGLGGFGMFLKQQGIPEVHCYDADPIVVKTSGGLCQTVDLGKEQPSLPKVDLAMTLEVGEHIPKEFEQSFLNNLAEAGTKAVVVSWAHPGQGGTRHVNEQPQWYIADQLRQRGYALDRYRTEAMRTSAQGCHEWWYSQNTMAFKKRDASAGHWWDPWREAWTDKKWLEDHLGPH